MKIVIFAISLSILSACGSTGIVRTGENTFMIAKTSPACGFRSADGTKAKIYKEANAYCSKTNSFVETVNMQETDGKIGARCASAELEFKCVSSKSNN